MEASGEYREEVAAVYGTYGKFLQKGGKYEEALEYHVKAYYLYQILLGNEAHLTQQWKKDAHAVAQLVNDQREHARQEKLKEALKQKRAAEAK